MNTTKFLSLFIICILLCTLSCKKEIFDCGNGEGNLETRIVELDTIEGFEIEADVKLIIVEGSPQQIQFNSYANLIDEILEDSDVDNDIWKIKFGGCPTGLNRNDVEIIATISELKEIEIKGSGQVKTQGVFNNMDDLMLKIGGSGDMELDLGATIDEVEIKVDGSGDIGLSGKANELKIEISGSGDFEGIDLETRICAIEISGSGDCQVNVEELLEIEISGSGDVCYSGVPIINSEVSGSGDIKTCD